MGVCGRGVVVICAGGIVVVVVVIETFEHSLLT